MPVLTTRRLRLRDWRPTDLEPFAALNADPNVMEFFPQTLSGIDSDLFAARIAGSLREKGFGLWAVEILDGAPFIGYVGLSAPSFHSFFTPCTEIGWRIGHDHWGRGYATEAATEVLRFAFDSLGLSEIVSFTATPNTRSRRVMERIGMHRRAGEDFDHPNVAVDSLLRRHVLYRLSHPTSRSAPEPARHSS